MSRFRYAALSLASGYAALGFTTIYQLASGPLVLHYLTKEEIGLWALITQVSSYLLLIDLGITSAVARILIDHKDNKETGEYGSLIKTNIAVLLVQGACIAVAGVPLAYVLPGIVDIPQQLLPIFRVLIAGQCLLQGIFYIGRIIMGILQAHQRFDAINYSTMLQLAVSFAAQWLTFHLGWGLYAVLVAGAVGSLIGLAHNVAWVLKLRLLPPSGAWGRVSGRIFKEIFTFGRDLLLLSIGLQLLNASQILIISRVQGLAAATVWSFATKAFLLAGQSVSRIFDFSGTAFGEMIVRGEKVNLVRRFRDVLTLTSSAAVFASVSVAVCNASFLTVWTKGRIAWPITNDVLMGILVLLNCISRCYIGLGGYAKQIRVMRWIYFLEGACFVLGALAVSRSLGMAGIIGMAVLSNILWSGGYGIVWGARYLELQPRELTLDWLRPAAVYLVVLAPLAAVLWWLTRGFPAWPRLLLTSALLSIVGAILFWFVGLTSDLRHDLAVRFVRLRSRFS